MNRGSALSMARGGAGPGFPLTFFPGPAPPPPHGNSESALPLTSSLIRKTLVPAAAAAANSAVPPARLCACTRLDCIICPRGPASRTLKCRPVVCVERLPRGRASVQTRSPGPAQTAPGEVLEALRPCSAHTRRPGPLLQGTPRRPRRVQVRADFPSRRREPCPRQKAGLPGAAAASPQDLETFPASDS